MEIRKINHDGNEYFAFTASELEDYKDHIILEQKAKSIEDGTFQGITSDEFTKIMKSHGLL